MGSSPSKRRPQSRSYSETPDTVVAVEDVCEDEIDDVKGIELQEQSLVYDEYENYNYDYDSNGYELEITDETNVASYGTKEGSGYYSDPNYDVNENTQTYAHNGSKTNVSPDQYYSYDVEDEVQFNKNDFAYDGLENEDDVDIEFIPKDSGCSSRAVSNTTTITDTVPGQIQ